MPDTTRRRTVLSAGAAALAGTALAGCGGDGAATDEAPTGKASSTESGGTTVTGGGPSPADGSRELGTVADIPVGGGKVFKDAKLVVTQPTAGEFKAFSALCTHQGCSVASVSDGHIVCPCHQSRFNVSDGSVAAGPAARPLPPAEINVAGGRISLG
ncbi:Rieske (2Fe-2S) protein [Streptomyces wedmorensis]|uniref:Rieske (2Fe-2S) protein n=1 Tax=Streptomyces wedmorensis TaxID=43759 RepID=UPI0037A51F3E